jgi:hypothetical protein
MLTLQKISRVDDNLGVEIVLFLSKPTKAIPRAIQESLEVPLHNFISANRINIG